MSLRRCCVAVLALIAPLAPTAAQDEPVSDERLAPSLLFRSGLGALLPVGGRGALTVTMSLGGSVSSRSGNPSSPPRSSVLAGIATGYLRFGPEAGRLRTFKFARLSYSYDRISPEPHNPSHTGGLSVGYGGLAQVTPRFGVMADVGLNWSVRKQFSENGVPGFPSFSSTITTTSWGIGTAIGATLRAKPKRNP